MDKNLILNAILSLLGSDNQTASPEHNTPELKKDVLTDFIGKYVLIRHHMFGVNTGYLSDIDSENIVLTQSRKLWRWSANNGVSLEDVAMSGLNHNGDIKISDTVDRVIISRVQLLGVISIDEEKIVTNIKSAPIYKN